MSSANLIPARRIWYPDRGFVEFATRHLVPILFGSYDESEPDFQYIGGDHGRGLLESSLARPQPVFGQDRYPNMEDKAAALIWSITKNHPFNDGNKRAALTTGYCFLIFNLYFVVARQEEAVEMCLGVAAGREGYDEKYVASWLRERSMPILGFAKTKPNDPVRRVLSQLSDEDANGWSFIYTTIAAYWQHSGDQQ